MNLTDTSARNRIQQVAELNGEVYAALATIHTLRGDTALVEWLFNNNHGRLAICPECNRRNFMHYPDCVLGASLRQAFMRHAQEDGKP